MPLPSASRVRTCPTPDCPGQRVVERQSGLSAYRDAGLRIAQKVRQLGCLVGGIERVIDKSGAQSGEIQPQNLGGLLDLHGHPVTGHGTEAGQIATGICGQRYKLFAQLSARLAGGFADFGARGGPQRAVAAILCPNRTRQDRQMKTLVASLALPALAGTLLCLTAAVGPARALEGPTENTGAPAGQYQLDPLHSSLSFSVNHLGLSNYVVRFTSYTVLLHYDPAQPDRSSVTASIDPASLRTYYPADYRASHPDSKFASWDDELSQSDKFFNAGAFPQITFRSTAVQATGPGALHIVGELTLLGQTHPVELEANVVGSTANFPMTPGLAAIGFSAHGSLQRSAFGMNFLLDPPLISDAVTIQFEGEFHQLKK